MSSGQGPRVPSEGARTRVFGEKDGRREEAEAARRQQQVRVGTEPSAPAAPRPDAPVRGRTETDHEDSDLVLDVPQLTLDELAFQLQGAGAIEHVSLEVKGLHASVLLTADLDDLAVLARGRVRGRASDAPGRMAAARRWAPRLVSGQGGGKDDGDEGEGAAEQHHEDEHEGDEGRGEGLRRRVAGVARQGGKAATLAAVGAAAGGALAESRRGGRRRRALPAHLPRPLKGVLPDGGKVAREVRRRLPG